MRTFSLIISLLMAAATTVGAGAAPLPRANVVLASALNVDLAANTVTLPLHKGSANGKTIWYIITDSSDAAEAKRLGILFSPLLSSAGTAIADASGTITNLTYPGTVDFSATRVLKTGPAGGPTTAQPGSVGDANYSPLVRLSASGPVYNAPIVASGETPHDIANHTDVLDRVVAINASNPSKATATFVLSRGYTNGQPIAYISTDSSDEAPAAIERSTYVPRLKKLTSGAIPIDVFFGGKVQGIPFQALTGKLAMNADATNAASLGSPLNIQATFPAPDLAASGYSPMWSVYPLVWTDAATGAGKVRVLKSQAEVTAAATAGDITAPDGKPVGAPGIIVNCPVMAFAVTRPK
jgi:hypothetical protein